VENYAYRNGGQKFHQVNAKLVQYSIKLHNINKTIEDKKFIVKFYMNTKVSNSTNKIKPIQIQKGGKNKV
jgi:hypothetical protein